jgi:hypothetical protein
MAYVVLVCVVIPVYFCAAAGVMLLLEWAMAVTEARHAD